MTTQAKRLNPQRAFKQGGNHIKRIALNASVAIQAHVDPKPMRTPNEAKNWFLVVAHSDKGLLDEHAHQVIAAAAILADSNTAVAVLVMGNLYEDLAELGADEVIVLPAPVRRQDLQHPVWW